MLIKIGNIIKPILSSKFLSLKPRQIYFHLSLKLLYNPTITQYLLAHLLKREKDRKINLAEQLRCSFGNYRSRLYYVLHSFKNLHNPHGVLLDVFIERTFSWKPRGVTPHLKPWIGFIHVPPNLPRWFLYQQANKMISKSESWKKSYPAVKVYILFHDIIKSIWKEI